MNKPIQEVTTKRKQACERMLSRQFSEDSNEELDTVREYFYYGDIKKYIAESTRITDMVVFEATPFTRLEDYLENIKIYWEWVLESPNERGDKTNLERPVEKRLFGKIQYYSLLSHCLPDRLKCELFFWCFGNTYDPERIFPMALGPENWQFKINMDVDWVCSELMHQIRNYLMGYGGEDKVYKNGKYYIDYFLSLYPFMSVRCFDLIRFTENFYMEDGRQINLQGYQLANRWFIAGLNNILTLHEEEEDVKQLTIHDNKAFTHLKEGLLKPAMPNEYYQLEEFVIEHGVECLFA